ncbi:hypothetical protein HD554DRAFT_2176584 [Boletus coccyginus]|nr:hypothetical protein HD554DRAFT_2176584 [Boletus coccyginus]
MQQLQNDHRGSNPDVDPEFDEPAEPSSNSPASTTIHPKDGQVDMTLNWSSDNRVDESHTGEPGVQNHMMELSHIFPDYCTPILHERLDPPKGGAQVHYSITFQELMPITKLVGDQFLSCWWDTVKSHFVLWKNGIYHCDISVANLKYKVEGSGVAGVLIDFDLARVESVAGSERIGTLPSMALDLLAKEGLAGKI